MKKVIYCFSGTGNSLRAARIIADELKDTEIVNVRKDPSEYRFTPAHTFDSYYIYPIKRAYGFYMR